MAITAVPPESSGSLALVAQLVEAAGLNPVSLAAGSIPAEGTESRAGMGSCYGNPAGATSNACFGGRATFPCRLGYRRDGREAIRKAPAHEEAKGQYVLRIKAMACVAVATFAVLATVAPSAAVHRAADWHSKSGTRLWPGEPCPGGDCPESKGGWLP
jgi:hypothetical protein